MNYTVYAPESNFSISGPSLEAACKTHFEQIVKRFQIGNVAGYTLDRVWFTYVENTANGKPAAVLNVLSHGSEDLIDYDPTGDEPKHTQIFIEAEEADLPADREVSLVETEEADKVNPFCDDVLGKGDNYIRGIIHAIIDEIGEHHCVSTENGEVCMVVSSQYPNMKHTRPLIYIETCRKILAQRRPKSDVTTAKLQERISVLLSALSEPTKYDEANAGMEMVSYYTTCRWFTTNGKVTALAKLRKAYGLTQQAVADAVGITLRQYQRYESPTTGSLDNASEKTIKAIAKAVGTTTDKFIDKNGAAILVPSK